MATGLYSSTEKAFDSMVIENQKLIRKAKVEIIEEAKYPKG
jgi:hypothetical protein